MLNKLKVLYKLHININIANTISLEILIDIPYSINNNFLSQNIPPPYLL